MSTRPQRRRQARGGSPTNRPPQRDPMRMLYIGLAIAIALIVIAFGLLRFKQNRDYADALATPSPGPNATQKAVPLSDSGTSVGKPAMAPGDNKGGGAGGPVDGIKCEATEQVTMHIHSHLALFVSGKQIQIPQFIGVVPTANNSSCLYWIHTHDASGVIHVESPELRQYVLGNFFDIWGEDLNRNQVGPYSGPVTAFINGAKYDGDLAQIPLRAHQQITLEVGTPIVPPPNYSFPPSLSL